MNTIHDLGGMDGFTLKERDQGFPLHEEWERQIWGAALSLWAKPIPGYSEPFSRAHIERIPPELYINMPYYAKWLQAQEDAMVNSGLVTREELAYPDGPVTMPNTEGFVPTTPAEAIAFIEGDMSFEVPQGAQPKFAIGERVIVRNEHPRGHTRVPRYTRGRKGIVDLHHGTHVLEDHFPEGEHPGPQHLYTVVFTASELWGRRGHPNDRISAEFWEVHLEAAEE